MCLDNLNIFSESQQYKLLEFHLPLFIFTVKQKKCTNLSQSLLEKLDTLKLHLLRMTLWRNSKHTILVILLNWTSQFNLAAFLSLQDKNLKKSSFHVPNRSWLVWSLLQNTLWLATQAKSSATAKATAKGAGLGWLQHCCDVAYLQESGIKLPEKYPFYSPLLFIQHCWRSNRGCYKLLSGSWYATWNIAHTHTYAWALGARTKAPAQNCLFCL